MERNPLASWWRKAIGTLLLIAFAPVLLLALVQAINEVLGPLIPYVVVLLMLLGLYRLVLGRRRS